MNHIDFMKRAIALAKKGIGWTNPNPLVGCVIVKNGQIVAEGYHQRCGEWHAERNAILNCNCDLQNATLYVTLEPCCHYGKTPPCTDLIIKSGIQEVVIGSSDPNPLVSGKGAQQLREAGITVIENVLQNECDQLNAIFFHYIRMQKPYVLMKYAMSADGKIATVAGESKWITGEIARNHVQLTRHQYCAIMVGVATVLADDPWLNCRLENARQPIRIICDSQLRTPLTSRVVQSAKDYRTIIATINEDPTLHQPYQQLGVEIWVLPAKDKRVDLTSLLQRLGENEIDSLLLEGGAELNFSALRAGIVNQIHCYIAPKLMGGALAKTPIGGAGIAYLSEAVKLQSTGIQLLGEDILLTFNVVQQADS